MTRKKAKGGASFNAVAVPPGTEVQKNVEGSTEGVYVAPAPAKVDEFAGQEYDGLITNAVVYENMIHGNMYNDRKKRFPDGKHIRTSAIMEYREDGMVRTNNSLYKVEWTQAQLDAFAAKKEL